MLVETAVKSMETAMEAMASMEMASGALPCLRWWQRRIYGTSSGKWPIHLGFRSQRLYIGGEAALEGGQGPHTMRWRAPGVTRATMWCGGPLAPLWLSFSLHPASGKNRSFGFCFVQFREYFLCSFSETQKQQKTGNWHYGILSIG
jgi:hypothetical protein